jgi:outer membrane protein assembly factor BamB
MPSIDLTCSFHAVRTAHGALSSVASCGLDVTLGGERLAAASASGDAVFLVRDLVVAAVTVAEGRAQKAHIPFPDAPMELCLTAGDGVFLVSAYRTGTQPEVRVHDHPVSVRDLVTAAESALASLPSDKALVDQVQTLCARLSLCAPNLCAPQRTAGVTARWRSRVRTSANGSSTTGAVAIAFDAQLSVAAGGGRAESARADLHALLARGAVAIELRGRRIELPTGYVFLQIERMVSLCRPLLEAWAARRSCHVRAMVGTATVGLRLGLDEQLSVTVQHNDAPALTAPALMPRAWIAPVLDAALALASAMARADRSLARNLRLRALRTETRALRRWLRGIEQPDNRVNTEPALYRAGNEATASTRIATATDIAGMTRLRYTQRWRAEIEGIDLAGMLLVGDRLIVPGSRELHALDRVTGAAVWSTPAGRAATTLAGDNILRFTTRGDVELRASRTGETLWSTRIAARVGTPVAAHTISAPGLPRLVVLAEGERRLVALDLRTGEARWTWTSRHGGAFRVRRVGRLLVVCAGDATVSAIDLASGEVVWRYAGRIPFATAPCVHREQVFALAGEGARGSARLHSLDAFTGALQWVSDTDAAVCAGPVATGDTVSVALATRDGIVLAGYDTAGGEARFRTPIGALPGIYGARPAITAVDDRVVANLPNGRVVALDARDGVLQWTQAFRSPVSDDVPRKLDVQLRAGALFVPQSVLAVLRPTDGAVLAEVSACDLVPDVVRVDEHCALYVAEESGHVGCYEPSARLRVIRSE